MNRITEITRRDIIDLFRDGYIEYDWLSDEQRCIYYYYGRLTEVEFLKKLYQLEDMPSHDPRFENAESDILQHTINDNDWESHWVFKDDRFDLFNGGDNVLLDFLCAVFHPENRNEKGYWKEYLNRINKLIKTDEYELYESEKISGRVVYSWRKITKEESTSGRFIPFSVRKKHEIETKNIKLSIRKKVRREILHLFDRYDKQLNKVSENSWNYSISTKEAVIEDTREYYVPKAFYSNGNYIETNDFSEFILNNHPYYVFDAIELFAKYNCDNNFVDEVNALLNNNGFAYKLLGGKIEIQQPSFQAKEIIKEKGLKELIEQANASYNSNNILDKQNAVEKIWDAFERLKTYYSYKKKDSVEIIIRAMANENDAYIALFNKEFEELTKIGNNYRIRHHETNRTNIVDHNYYDYFYQRCYAMINLALKYLK